MADEQRIAEPTEDTVLVARDDAGLPAWELRYDDPDTTTILHNHGTQGVPTSFKDRGDGVWVAQCTECDESLEVRGTPGAGDGGSEPKADS
jgi:hypothetical protein